MRINGLLADRLIKECFSTRPANALLHQGFRKLGDIPDWSRHILKTYKYLGRNGLDEIESFLKTNGVKPDPKICLHCGQIINE